MSGRWRVVPRNLRWSLSLIAPLVLTPSILPAQIAVAPGSAGVEAPHLIFPLDRADLTTPNPVFQWTPVTGVSGASYRFRLVEVIGDQTPREALEGDRPVLETLLYQQTLLLYPTAAYPLRAGYCYAWQVQSVTVQGTDFDGLLSPVGVNGGRSQINTFCYRPVRARMQARRSPADTTAGTGVPLTSPPVGAYGVGPADPGGGWMGAPAGGVTATGTITAYGESYGLSGTGGTRARPDQTGRIEVHSVLALANGLVQVPLQALLSTDQVSFRQEINRLGISPTWRDYTFHAGYFTPRFTDLTLSDATLLGGGVEGHPGALRFDLAYGRARRAIGPQAGRVVEPEFARWMGVGRLGWQAPSGFLLEASIVDANDRTRSLGGFGDTTTAAAPQDNLVFGVHGKAPFAARRLWLEVEGTRSRYTADLRTGASAVTGVAGSVALTWQTPGWSAGGKVTYVGPDYHALGNTQLQSDQVRYEATAQMHQGTVSLGVQAGLQQNNLDHVLQSTTKMRGIYSVTMSWQASPVFGLDGSASNILNDIQSTDPMLALRNVNASYVLTPRLAWQTGADQHLLVASGTWQTASNSSQGIVGLQDTRTGSGMLAYTLTFPSGVALSATGNYTQVKVDTVSTNLASVYPALAFPAIQGRLQTMIGVQWSASGIAGASADHELYPQLNTSFTITARQQLTLQVSRRHYAYGSAMPGAAFNETMGSLTWRDTF